VAYFTPPKGMNTLPPLSRLPPEYSPDMANLILDQGVLISRKGLAEVGSPGGSTVMAVFSFVNPDGLGFLFRLRIDGLDYWNGTGWTAVGGLTFTGSIHDRFTWTGWGDELLICNGIDKIRSYNTRTGVVNVLDESFPCRHLTTFDSRVIASATLEGNFLGARQRWSVKNDNTDWTSETTEDGIGAGFEDLRGTPGGYVDEIMGTYPLSDDTALVIRANSLWLQFVTGNVDAPFRYSRLTSEVGTRSRHSPVATPYGIALLTLNDVVVVTQSGPQPIGQAVRRSIISDVGDPREVTGSYDPRRQEYRLCVGSTVWRYSFVDQGWTRDQYGIEIRHLSFVDYRALGLRIGELVGIIGDLTDTIGDLRRDEVDEGMHLVAAGFEQVLHETDAASDDNDVAVPISITTGLLQSESPLDRTEIIEAQVEYESDEAQELIFEYSLDRGTSWLAYSVQSIAPTTGPKVLAVRKTLTHHNLQIRVRSENLGKLKLIGLYLFVVKGAKVNP